MKNALVVGGSSGIGLAVVQQLILNGYDKIYIVSKGTPNIEDLTILNAEQFKLHTVLKVVNLITDNYDIFDEITDIDTLIITAGFGRIATFEKLDDIEIQNLIKCNFLSAVRIIRKYYNKIKSKSDFYCAVMGSICGHITSPLFSVYGAAKFGLCSFVENINVELTHDGYTNRILDVSPGALKGTNFNGTGNNLELVNDVAKNLLKRMYARELLYIPDYEKTYKRVIERYYENPIKYGIESYDYKLSSARTSSNSQTVIGYLSGTFDLFHIGHLNLLKRAKKECDYLIVGVHKNGAWKGKETFIPFEERKAIVESIKYVDKVIESFAEDCDAWEKYHYHKLFVGSDYKGTERFKRYEEYFSDKGVKIVYFPYTQGISSTQIRATISEKNNLV